MFYPLREICTLEVQQIVGREPSVRAILNPKKRIMLMVRFPNIASILIM